MKEVKLKRFAGPYKRIPFKNNIQSPIGLVPKAGGQMQLIFHLSYNFSENKAVDGSVNYFTPDALCSVKYNDLDYTVQTCLKFSGVFYLGKADMKSAFRLLGLNPEFWCWLVMKAEDPKTVKFVHFINKCLPFGASISCTHFQRFSNALRHLIEEWLLQRKKQSGLTLAWYF